MVNVRALSMTLYFHYIYKNDPAQIKIKGYHSFTANSEIVKVNRVQHPFRTLTINPNDEFNYLASPANYHTKVRIPLARLRQRIKTGDKHLDVNSAVLKLNVQDRSKWGAGTGSVIPYISSVLLIKESAIDDFFTKHELPSDTVSFVATLGYENITATTYKYNYTFSNLANLIENELKKNSTDEYLDMVLVPVSLVQSSSASSSQSYLTEVNQSTQVEAVSIFSGKNKEIPMKLEVVYSGF